MRNASPIIFIIALIIPQFSLSQSTLDYGNEINHVKVCNYVQASSFSSNKEADTALDLILSTIGAEKRFVLKPCSNISNAVALQMSGIRYIFYDPVFINNISRGEFWIKFFVLAHEVGHHINGHVVDIDAFGTKKISLYERRLQELESDRFAGFVLSKLGASLNQTIAAVSQGSNSDDTYSTHPNRDKRVLAAKQGFNKAKSSESIYTKSNADKAEELFYKATELLNENRNKEAIDIYNYLISNNQIQPYIYHNRGEAYYTSGKNNLALKDFKFQIILTPNNSRAHFSLGNIYHLLGKNDEAVLSYVKAIELMESGDDYKHLSSFSKPNSNAIVWSYALASLNMRKSKKYSRYSCRYAKKALQMNKNVNTLKQKVYLKLVLIVNMCS